MQKRLRTSSFDREHRLHSVPASLGEAWGIRVARLLHAGTVAALAAVGVGIGASWLYALGVGVVALLLVYEHALVRNGDLTKLDAAFFRMNGIISITFFAFVLAERLVR